MSTLALMRLLEGTPRRYDRGMRWLTFGRDDTIRAALAEAMAPKRPPGHAPVVLEIGCGTGALTEHLLGAGATVTALDQNPEMLELARERLGDDERVVLLERTAAEIDAFPAESFDAVVASFAFSEMSASERQFVFSGARRALRPGGVLAVADEVRPRSALGRVLFAALRLPQALLAWLAIGSVSHPLADPARELAECGFHLLGERRWLMGHLALLTAERPS